MTDVKPVKAAEDLDLAPVFTAASAFVTGAMRSTATAGCCTATSGACRRQRSGCRRRSLLLREQLQAIPLLRALIELEPAILNGNEVLTLLLHTVTCDVAENLHSSRTDRGFGCRIGSFKFRIWFGIGLHFGLA